MRKVTIVLSCLILSSALTACTHSYYPFLYRPPLSQGNVIDSAAFAELKPGMNKAQVVNLVGEPVLEAPFSPDVWHYVYVMRKNGKVVQSQQATLYFSGDNLVRVIT